MKIKTSVKNYDFNALIQNIYNHLVGRFDPPRNRPMTPGENYNSKFRSRISLLKNDLCLNKKNSFSIFPLSIETQEHFRVQANGSKMEFIAFLLKTGINFTDAQNIFQILFLVFHYKNGPLRIIPLTARTCIGFTNFISNILESSIKTQGPFKVLSLIYFCYRECSKLVNVDIHR